MTNGSEIEAFIRARLDEDEALAEVASPGPWRVNDQSYAEYILDAEDDAVVSGSRWAGEARIFDTNEDALHIAAHDPARTLRECKALRALIESTRRRVSQGWGHHGNEHLIEADLAPLAAIWSDHPDFRPEWAPVEEGSQA